MNSCDQVDEAALHFSPSDSSSGLEGGDTGDVAAVIRDVKQEIDTDEDFSSVVKSKKMTFSDILRVKVREDTMQCAVARLGGGSQGLQVLMEHVKLWALQSPEDEDVMIAIRRGILRLGMPPSPQRSPRSCITTSGEGYGGAPYVDAKASPCGTSDRVDQGAAHTRALRKSHMERQRGLTRAQQRQSPMIKYENQPRQCRISTMHDHGTRVNVESDFSNENWKGYDFLFRKVLRASDVNSLGRIILPKKDAERYLPYLVVREGIMLSFQDYNCAKFWTARYRFWPNNKSRMYHLDNIGDFVSFHNLQQGDLLLCYRTYQGVYVIRGEKVLPNVESPAVKKLSLQCVQAGPTTEMKCVTTIMPATHQIVEEDIPCGSNFRTSGSWNCTLGETDDAKYCEDGEIGRQSCFSRQSWHSTCLGDELLSTNSPATYKPLEHDEGFESDVPLLYFSNLKHRYLEEDQFGG